MQAKNNPSLKNVPNLEQSQSLQSFLSEKNSRCLTNDQSVNKMLCKVHIFPTKIAKQP